MADWNFLGMCVFGGVLGFMLSAIPTKTMSRTPLVLNQEWKFAINAASGAWILVTVAAIGLTDLTFRWKPFLGAMFAVALPIYFLSLAVLEGRVPGPWKNVLRSLYRNESYRDVAYEPSHGPFLEIFDPIHSFSITNALVSAHMSRVAYHSLVEIQEQAAGWPARIRFLEERNHAGLVVAMRSVVIVAFRGTDEARDWLTNLSIWQRTPWGTEWGSVHAGFLSAVEALWPKLTKALEDLECERLPVWLTGHSLGGAMAVLAGAKMLNERADTQILGICTFGQPMVGNDRFARTFRKRMPGRFVRFVAARDDVPNQPPNGNHCGTLMYFDRNGGVHENPGYLAMFWEGMRRDALGPAGDHPMREYLRLIDLQSIQLFEARRAQEATA
jgi:triacylglycerol lipase